jgi:fucose 4-O-acetylase-like acetyltransferase
VHQAPPPEKVPSPVLQEAESRRLTALRFPLIVAVVLIHANNDRIGLPTPDGGAAQVAHVTRRTLSDELAAVAVPLYFLLAGFLFFAGLAPGPAPLRAKLARRMRTLLVPFLVWNVALGAAFLAVGHFPREPLALLDATFGITRPPAVYPFWFLRDLMIAVALAPLLAPLARRAPWLGLIVFGVPWLTHTWPIKTPGAVSLGFFFVGAATALHGRSLFALDRWTNTLTVTWWLVIAFIVADATGPAFPYLHQLGILLGVGAVLGWSACVLARPTLERKLITLAASAFFVFAAHEPALTLARRVATKIVGDRGPVVELALYLALPCALIVTLVIVHRILVRVAPRAVQFATGGR